jgi:threonine dehydrogenase-like Zn-dependent dehydrogenase
VRAAIYPGAGQPVVIATVPDPVPGPGEVVIRVDRCGICGTDLSMTKGAAFDFGTNVQFGHEYAGEIVAAGANVQGWKAGDRICAIPSLGCGQCMACDHGNNVLCRTGGSAAAGFAEYARVPISAAVRLPQSLSLADGALIEPLAVSLYGLRHSGMQPGARVLVLGGGTVALYAIYWARIMGAGRILAMSRSTRRADLALTMGADAFVAFGDEDVGAVQEALGGAPDLVLECVGAPGLLARAVTHVRPFGQIVSLGFCTAPDPLMPALAAYKCAAIRFLVGYGPDEFRHSADTFDKGHVDPGVIVSRTVLLDDLPATMAALRQPNADTKVHVRMG